MTDSEFLQYCLSHSQTQRAAFVSSQLARLCRLAGYEDLAKEWDERPNEIIDGYGPSVYTLANEIVEANRL